MLQAIIFLWFEMGRKPKPAEERKLRADFYISQDLVNALARIAEAKKTTRSRIIEEAIKEYFERHKEEVPAEQV